VRPRELVRDLDSDDLSVKLDADPRDPVKALTRPLVSEPAIARVPDRDLNSELFSTKPEAKDREPLRDLYKEVFSAMPETRPSELVRALARLLVSEPVRLSEPDRDLKRELFSAKPEAMVKVAVRLVEQERGLVLQTSFPESTLATVLPIVSVIEAAKVLKIEFFSARLEARVNEPVRLRL
jgi:hypothetical protein